MHVGIFEAKTRLSELVEQAMAGHEVIITRHGRPVARIAPIMDSRSEMSSLVEDIKRFRKNCKLPKGVTIRELINEGRR